MPLRLDARIAVQCNLLSRRGGGLPSAILPVAERLGKETFLVTFAPPEDPNGLDVVTVPSAPHLGRNLGLLTGRKAQLVHTHGLWSSLSVSAMLWRRRTGGPTIVSPHGMMDPWALNHHRLRKRIAMSAFERAHLNGAALVHALNQSEAEAIRAAGITAPIAIVPNGVEATPPAAPDRPDWMNRPTLLFLGRLHEKKGIAALIEAFAKVSPHMPEWQLALAGWDDGPNEFRERAASSGAPIRFTGPLYGDDKAAAYAHAGAFILPSFSEGLPMTVLEAWSYGRPVLMTDACNLPEGFEAGAAARIETDPMRLADALHRTLLNRKFLAEAGQAGQRLVQERFSWDAIARRFEALYAFALGQGPAPEDLWDDTRSGVGG